MSRRLRTDFENGRSYYPFDGTKIVAHEADAERPGIDFLLWQDDEVFAG